MRISKNYDLAVETVYEALRKCRLACIDDVTLEHDDSGDVILLTIDDGETTQTFRVDVVDADR